MINISFRTANWRRALRTLRKFPEFDAVRVTGPILFVLGFDLSAWVPGQRLISVFVTEKVPFGFVHSIAHAASCA